MAQIELSNQQAQKVAQCIYADIVMYVEDHWAEYETFLMKEGQFDQRGVKTNGTVL